MFFDSTFKSKRRQGFSFGWTEMPNKEKIVEICINETVYDGLNFFWLYVPLYAINSI